MRKIVLACCTLLVFSATTQAQSNYSQAVGLKLWDGAGVSYKHFFNDSHAGELIGYFWRQGTRITGLYEIHKPIASVDGLQWYFGPGAHIGFYNGKYGDGIYAGVDGVVGLDYKIPSAPINISLDWQPSFEFGDGRGFVGSWGGIGIRYVLK